MIKYLLIMLALIQSLDALNLSNVAIGRRCMLKLIPALTLLPPMICQSEEIENKPLTKEEMEEYERLLEQAKRIQSIIDSNIKASNEQFEKQLKELKKNK
jgi:hypothetical protein